MAVEERGERERKSHQKQVRGEKRKELKGVEKGNKLSDEE